MAIGRASRRDGFGKFAHRALRYWAAMVLLAVGALPAIAAVEGDLGLLKLVVKTHQANAQAILTWRGTGEVETIVEDRAGSRLNRAARASFLYDRSLDATLWTWTYTASKERRDGRIVSTLDGLQHSSLMTRIRTKDTYYRYERNILTADGEYQYTLVIFPREVGRVPGNFSDDFDPMWYLTRHGNDPPEYLMSLIEKPAGTDLRISRDEGVVLVDIRGPTGDQQLHFDLSKGGNLVQYSFGWKGGSTRSEWTYADQDGVWLPTTFTNQHLTAMDDEDVVKRTRRVRFVASRANQPIDAKEFSVENLGLKLGTRITDHRTGRAYRYAGEVVD